MPRSEYSGKVHGSRGSVERQGSQRHGIMAEVAGPGYRLSVKLYKQVFSSTPQAQLWWCKGDASPVLLYEDLVSEMLSHIQPHSVERRVCPTIRSYREALQWYANKRSYKKGMFSDEIPIIGDHGDLARQILDGHYQEVVL